MKSSTMFALLTVPALAGVACEGRHALTGPDAQRTFAEAQADAVLPSSTLVFVDGKRMPTATALS